MKIIKVTTSSEGREGNTSSAFTQDGLYIIKGWITKRLYYVSNNVAQIVPIVDKPIEEKK